MEFLTDTPDIWEIEPVWLGPREVGYGSGSGMPDLRPAAARIDHGHLVASETHPDRLSIGMVPASRINARGDLIYVQRCGNPFRRRLAVWRRNGGVDPLDVEMPAGATPSAPLVSHDFQFALIKLTFQDESSDIFRLDLHQGQGRLERLTHSAQEEGYYALSLDGRQLSWSRENTSGGRDLLALALDADGRPVGEPRLLLSAPDGQVRFFSSISAGGDWLYFDEATEEGFSLFRLSLTDRHARPQQLTRPQP